MITVEQLIHATRVNLGVKQNDPEYPDAVVREALLSVFNELHGDCRGINAGLLLTTALIEATAPDSRTYQLWSQTTIPASTNIVEVKSLRAEDERGLKLTPVEFDRLDAYAGQRFTYHGTTEPTITTSPDVAVGIVLHLRYMAGIITSAEAMTDMPTFIPDPYKLLVALMACEPLYGHGGESAMPASQTAQMNRLRGNLWDEWMMRGAGLHSMRVDVDEGITPHLF